jgi:hypothetical protein
VLFQDVTPRAAPDERRPHACGPGRLQVVVQPVTYVDDLPSRARGCIQQCAEKRRVRLACLPVIGRGNHVCRQVQLPQDFSCARCLVSGHPNPDAHSAQFLHGRARVRVQVAFPETLWISCFRAPCPFLVKTETRSKELECLPVILALRDNRAKY